MTSPTTKDTAFCVQDLTRNKCSSAIASKKKNRRGGLSMFLSGALDDATQYVAPLPPSPRSEGPAWGGAKTSKGFASLREIQNEQSKTKGSQSANNRDHGEDPFNDRSDGKINLSSFLPSMPIPVISIPIASTHTSLASDGDRGTPPWTASGTPPLLSRPSLRDIQMQQGKKHQSLSHSPKTKTAGFSVSSGQSSPLDASGVNCWFKPEVDAPSSIRSIQIEEKAMKELRRFYDRVKIVKKPILN